MSIHGRPFVFERFDVCLDHDPGPVRVCVHAGLPTEFALGMTRIPDQCVHLGRPKIPFVESNVVFPVQTCMFERDGQEVAHRVVATGGEHKILRLVDLQHAPHSLHVLRRISPVANRIEIAHVQMILDTCLDACDRARDLPRHECLTTPGGLVIEQNSVHSEDPVCLTIVLGDPVRVHLRRTVGRTWVERCLLVLRWRCVAPNISELDAW